MTPKRFMLIAGEPSGDMLAAELVRELRAALGRLNTYSTDVQPLRADLAPRFFGAGGPRMAGVGVELAFDLTKHALIGLPGPRTLLNLCKRFNQLVALACEREPHAIICVDFPLFNALFAAAVKKCVRARRGPFNNWQPLLVKYISPQVWASREYRARQIARDFDLLLSIFPFEKAWYAARVPKLRVEFVGHPMMDRYSNAERGVRNAESKGDTPPLVVLLPGSRPGELKRHLPIVLGAFQLIQTALPNARARIVLPNDELRQLARQLQPNVSANVEIDAGDLAESLSAAALAIAKTGTISLECAYFGVPTVTLYRTNWLTYEVGKRLVKIKSATMPNLLAGEAVFPEFVEEKPTPQNLSRAALELLRDPARQAGIRHRLREVIASLGPPGASRRAAEAILRTLG